MAPTLFSIGWRSDNACYKWPADQWGRDCSTCPNLIFVWVYQEYWDHQIWGNITPMLRVEIPVISMHPAWVVPIFHNFELQYWQPRPGQYPVHDIRSLHKVYTTRDRVTSMGSCMPNEIIRVDTPHQSLLMSWRWRSTLPWREIIAKIMKEIVPNTIPTRQAMMAGTTIPHVILSRSVRVSQNICSIQIIWLARRTPVGTSNIVPADILGSLGWIRRRLRHWRLYL